MNGSNDSSAHDALAAAPETVQPNTNVSAAPQASGHLRELGLWLLALHSFLNLHNHPLDETGRAELLNHDFSPELRVAQQTLRRCLRLLLTLQPAASSAAHESHSAFIADAGGPDLPELAEPEAQGDRLVALVEMLGDAQGLCEALLGAPRISLHGWGSFGRTCMRELAQLGAARRLMLDARAQTVLEQQPELFTLTERLTPDSLGADMQAIFARIALMLDELRFVGELLRSDAPLKQTLPLFTLVYEEARTLIELIERRALHATDLDAAARAELDSASYAIGMELCKVFAHELVGVAALRDPTLIYARIENAHGLLRDCLQQLIVALVQAFDPAFDGTRLFQTFSTRLEQSLVLRRDLWSLLEHVRRAEQEAEQQPLAPVLKHLEQFQKGSMLHLMFKDWEAFERFVLELKEAKDPNELRDGLHRFNTFLEALFSQINMRAVLAAHPFDYAANVG